MGFNYTTSDILFNVALALKDKRIKKIINAKSVNGLTFIKDYLPDDTPCWRLPTKEEEMIFIRRKNKNEI